MISSRPARMRDHFLAVKGVKIRAREPRIRQIEAIHLEDEGLGYAWCDSPANE